MHMDPPFRFLQFASYTFDASLIEILTTLMMGGTVCVPREEDRTNGNIAVAMEQMSVDMALLTPSFARTLAPFDVPHLKTLILGGEAMAQSHVEIWADKINLVNAYGPSECAVVATVNPRVHRSSNPANIGRGMNRCWIVDQHSHNRLAPVGSVGELLVEGPTLSSGYLNNQAKTREVFIEDPKWSADKALCFGSTSPRRMYKTGDLVRICDPVSGEMVYMGRKDSSQAKVNGQRLELDEIAHHLGADKAVRHAVVTLPREGPCANRLVAVLSLRGVSGESADRLAIVSSREASRLLSQVQHRLSETVPPYMVPTAWIVVNGTPILSSGKLDRMGMVRFIETLSAETFDQMTAAQSASETDRQEAAVAPDMSERLKSIWGQILNVAPERIGRTTSFLHLGGDSISAMQVMARCRAQGITVAVHDIVNAKSVYDLALKTQRSKTQERLDAGSGRTEEDHREFDPTPIQQLYLQLSGAVSSAASAQAQTQTHTQTHTQFNQSVLLRVTSSKRTVDSQTLEQGIHALVEAHPMLRARFRVDGTGRWRQRVTADVSGSYRFKARSVSNVQRVQKRIQTSQRALNVTRGPLLAADCLTVAETGETYLFMAVHHLVVDVVSWGILLQDLEDFFVSGRITSPMSMPFSSWSMAQSERAHTQTNGQTLLPHHENFGEDDNDYLAYWGMKDVPNVYGDVVSFEVDVGCEATGLLLGAKCHVSLQTDTLDVLLAALLVSFRAAMEGRKGTPRIFNEGHGRETWDEETDLSRTVGWFTTLYPVYLPEESGSGESSFRSSSSAFTLFSD